MIIHYSIMSILTVLSLMLLIGCESKVEETSPEKVQSDNAPIEMRIGEKAKTDEKLVSIKRAIEKVRKIFSIYNQLQSQDKGTKNYTHFDLLYSAISSIEEQIPFIDKYGKSIRISNLSILNTDKNDLLDTCRQVSLLIETHSNQNPAQESAKNNNRSNIKNSTDLELKIKGCTTNGKFIPFVKFLQNDLTFQLEFSNRSIDELLNNFNRTKDEILTKCEFIKTPQGSIQTLICENIYLKINEKESILFKRINYSILGELQSVSDIEIINENNIQTKAQLKVLRNGKVDFQIIEGEK